MKESGIEATMRIGHQGASDAIVAELRAQVKKRKVVKVKQLRTSPGFGQDKSFFQSLADRTGTRLLEVRGHTAVFCDVRYRTERDERKPPERLAQPAEDE